MVTWSADGTLAGYDPVTRRLKKGLYHFSASGPATVDQQAVTRLGYAMGAGINLTTYPNNIQAQASLAYTAADFAANPGMQGLGVGMIIARESRFPAGHKPTPAEMFNLPVSSIDWYQRATSYVFGPGGITHTFELPTGNIPYYPNTKWWILLYPAAHKNASAQWSKTNDAPVKGSNINTVGRVMSFWSNRTPGQPTITSPVSGSIALPGTEFTLRLNPADPDELAPEDSEKYNDDVGGVQFQYRPTPTPDVPNPDWKELPFDIRANLSGSPIDFRGEAWYIRGSRYFVSSIGQAPALEALVSNLGCPVVAGESASDVRPGYGALPTGDWQIRGRTFDFGHPYPNSTADIHAPGPLGINLATNYLIEPAKDTYPTANTSPWSEPVRISVPAQVPPPVPLYPKDDLAVSGNLDAVHMAWQYRNTHQPPRSQYHREVQIRKVGDLPWSTVYSGPGSDPFVDLPMSITQTPVLPTNVLPDGNFEGGTLGLWVNNDPNRPSVYTNVNNPAEAHSGNRYMKVSNAGLGSRFGVYTDDFTFETTPHIESIPPEYTDFALDGWFWLDASIAPVTVMYVAGWYDAGGSVIVGETDTYDTPYIAFFISKKFSGPAQWRRISDLVPDVDGTDYKYGLEGMLGADPARLSVKRPPNGVGLQSVVTVFIDHDDPEALPPYLTEMRVDDFTITATGADVDDFTMSPTNEYEWRVSATDTDSITSDYSAPARFWVVPAGGSGEVSPVPSETIDGATLGCGEYRVFVYRRGGQKRVGELTNLSHIDWARVRDDISTAQIVVSGWDLDCGNLLAHLQTWAYELVIYRDNGFSVDRVWEGPITLLTYENDKVTIDAKDVMGYAYRRIIKQKMTDSGKGNGTTVTDRARRVLQNVFAPDDPNILAYMQVLAQPDDAMQYRSTPAYSRTAYEEVDDMAANSGLDYTTVGRAILLWGTKHRIGTLPELRDEDLGASPIVSEYGMSMATRYSVSDGNGVHGEATRGLDPVSGNNEDYGLVEMLSSTWASDSEDDTGTYTQAGLATIIESFKDFAERSISDRFPPPVVVRVPDNTSLNPDTPLSIQHLVPGVVVPLRSVSTLRSVYATQKLDSVKVVVNKGEETVSITLSPFSRDDAATGEGEVDA